MLFNNFDLITKGKVYVVSRVRIFFRSDPLAILIVAKPLYSIHIRMKKDKMLLSLLIITVPIVVYVIMIHT